MHVSCWLQLLLHVNYEIAALGLILTGGCRLGWRGQTKLQTLPPLTDKHPSSQAQVFIPEQQVYSKQELDRHNKSGDPTGPLADSGFKGHPQCRFCRKRFYGDNELFLHMQARVHPVAGPPVIPHQLAGMFCFDRGMQTSCWLPGWGCQYGCGAWQHPKLTEHLHRLCCCRARTSSASCAGARAQSGMCTIGTTTS